MKIIIVTILVFILSTAFAHATVSSDEYLNCTAKKILEDCKNGIIGVDCDPGKQSILCDRVLEHNTESVIEYLSEYETENLTGLINYINVPILVCELNDKGLILKYGNAYIWDNLKIECPKIDNSVNLNTQGSNSQINYEDNRKQNFGNNNLINESPVENSWFSLFIKTIVGKGFEIIVEIIVGIIFIIIFITKKRKKKKS